MDTLSNLKHELNNARQFVRNNLNNLTGKQCVEKYTLMIDAIIKKIYHIVLNNPAETVRKPPPHLRQGCRTTIAILALGGYGRKELNIYSDVDLMFLYKDTISSADENIIKDILYKLWDLKLDLGYSIRSIDQCLKDAENDMHLLTSIIENRYLIGSRDVHKLFDKKLKAMFEKKTIISFFDEKVSGLDKRYKESGFSVYLLQPNIKESEGGLRDYHNILWLNYAIFKQKKPVTLIRKNLISGAEWRKLSASYSFLLRLRNALHLTTERKSDTLSFDYQTNTAKLLNYTGDQRQLAEEKLLTDYYKHAKNIFSISSKTISLLKREILILQGISSSRKVRKINDYFHSADDVVFILKKDPKFFIRNPHLIFDIFVTAQGLGLRVSDLTKSVIVTAIKKIKNFEFLFSQENIKKFLNILNSKTLVTHTLRDMYEVGLLSKIIPEFQQLFCMVRIDYYHLYTVDEHIFKAIESVGGLFDEKNENIDHDVAKVAKTIDALWLLNLSLLLHDIGKGEGHAHVLRGAQISERITERLKLSDEERSIVYFLVQNHLKMSHIALRRDISDENIIKDLAKTVETIETLKMLYVLTYADMKAISETVYNIWKGQLLFGLYQKTLSSLLGEKISKGFDENLRQTTRTNLLNLLPDLWYRQHLADEKSALPPDIPLDKLESFIENVPERYLISTPIETIAKQFNLALQLNQDNMIVWEIVDNEKMNLTEILVTTYDKVGIFYSIVGLLSSKELNINSAQTFTSKDGTAIISFQVTDLNMNKLPQGFRLERIREELNSILQGKKKIEDVYQPNLKMQNVHPERLKIASTRVDINNTDSTTHTIIEIRTIDRPGVLYTISRIISEFQLNLDLALISTEAYRVVDVFYVMDLENNKIEDVGMIEKIKTKLTDALKPDS